MTKKLPDLIKEYDKRPVSEHGPVYSSQIESDCKEATNSDETEQNHKEAFNRLLNAAVQKPAQGD